MDEAKIVPIPKAPKWKNMPHVGITLLALSAGAGELYAWPRLHALYGLDIAWLLIPAALIQLPLLVECQRIAIITGESFLVALSRISKSLASIVFGLVLISFFWIGGWIAGSAYAFSQLFKFPKGNSTIITLFWSVLLIVVFVLPLILGRFPLKNYLNRILIVFAVLTFILCITVVIIDYKHWHLIKSFLKSMFVPQSWPFGNLSLGERTDILLAVTFMGMGGWACILYTSISSLGRLGISGAKGINGDYLIAHPSALRASHTDSSGVKLISDTTEKSKNNLKKWMKLSWIETSIGVGGNLFTTSILAFLAFAILYGSRVVPGRDWDLLSAQSNFFISILGNFALPIFVILAASFLLDTWIGFGLILSQIYSETIRAVNKKARIKSVNWWFYFFLIIIIVQTIITIIIRPLTPGLLIRVTAVFMNVSTPILCILLIYLNYIFLPKRGPRWYKPKLISLLSIVSVGIIYFVLASWYLMNLFKP